MQGKVKQKRAQKDAKVCIDQNKFLIKKGKFT